MRWSLLGWSGAAKSYRRWFAASTAIRSAADIDEVGWPLFAAAAARTESTRNCCPSSRSSSALTIAPMLREKPRPRFVPQEGDGRGEAVEEVAAADGPELAGC